MSPSPVGAQRGSRGFSQSAGEHLAGEAGEAVDTEPDAQAVLADIDAVDQQRDDTGLLGGEEFLPQRVKVLQGLTGVCLGDLAILRPRGFPDARDDLGLAEHVAELVDDRGLDFAGRDATNRRRLHRASTLPG